MSKFNLDTEFCKQCGCDGGLCNDCVKKKCYVQGREKAFDDVLYKLYELLLGDCPKECECCIEQDFCPYDECNKDAIEIVKQLKGE